MRPFLPLLLASFGFALPLHGQSCTGLCLQQVTCPGGGTTTISGTVYAPNGTDPLPNIPGLRPPMPRWMPSVPG